MSDDRDRQMDELLAAYNALARERDRMRSALEEIADYADDNVSLREIRMSAIAERALISRAGYTEEEK